MDMGNSAAAKMLAILVARHYGKGVTLEVDQMLLEQAPKLVWSYNETKPTISFFVKS